MPLFGKLLLLLWLHEAHRMHLLQCAQKIFHAEMDGKSNFGSPDILLQAGEFDFQCSYSSTAFGCYGGRRSYSKAINEMKNCMQISIREFLKKCG